MGDLKTRFGKHQFSEFPHSEFDRIAQIDGPGEIGRDFPSAV